MTDPDALGQPPSPVHRSDQFWRADHIASAVDGHWCVKPTSVKTAAGPIVSGVSIDSRTIDPGQAFFALAGEHVDGRRFVADALEKGASLAVIEPPVTPEHRDGAAAPDGAVEREARSRGAGLLVVADALAALQQLAGAYRAVLAARGVRVIAVGGSNGKTSTRELIHTALAPAMPGSQSPKSFNNHLGVPLTLLAARCFDAGSGPLAPRGRAGVRGGGHGENESSPPLPDPLPPGGEGSGKHPDSRPGGEGSGKHPDSRLGGEGSGTDAEGGDRFLVCEVGTNHPGEIAPLARLVRPDIAVLTSLGREHLEHFGSIEAVAREEAALLHALPPEGLAIVEANAFATLAELGELPGHVPITTYCAPGAARVDAPGSINAGAAGLAPPARSETIDTAGAGEPVTRCTFRITSGPDLTATGQRFTVNDQWSIDTPILGRHNALNALAALAVGRAMGVAMATMISALSTARPAPHRMELKTLGPPGRGVTVLDDAYNANPDSMRAALRWLASAVGPGIGGDFVAPLNGDEEASGDPRDSTYSGDSGDSGGGGRRVAVLGDMRELGEASEPEHRALGRWLAENAMPPEVLITVGPAARLIGEALVNPADAHPRPAVHAFDQLDERTITTIVALLKPGDIVLLKASRDLALEQLLPAMESF